ncbi:MAG: hypothetical protein M1832_001539 [Thelocarpon impressellum]|nr:MAG: hypothetical protein M1832_001539 [Thelocarpon impressellum]
MRYSSILVGSALASLCRAMAWDAPAPTDASKTSEDAAQGFTPKPTDGPNLRDVTLELAKREVVPDNFCGFVSGLSKYPLSCSYGRTCYFYQFPSSLSTWGMAGCCTSTDAVNCGWAVDCINSADYYQSCGSSCRRNSFTLKCTNSARPYCQYFRYNDPYVLDYGCGSVTQSTWQTVSTTYIGQTQSANSLYFASEVLSDESLTRTFAPTYKPTKEATDTESTGTGTRTGIRATTTPTFTETGKKSVPVGAIAGGVVGGLFLIAAVVAGGILLCLRRRRQNRPSASGVPITATGAPLQPGTQYPPGQGPGGYQPVQNGPPMQQQVPQPQQPAPQGASFFAPTVDNKGVPQAQAYESNNTAYYGAGGQPPQPQFERPFSAEIDGSASPGSPLPMYNQGGYVPPPPQQPVQQDRAPEHQLHSTSSVPMLNRDNQAVYEAPGH